MSQFASLCCAAPFERYQQLLKDGPVWDSKAKAWLISRHADAMAVLKDGNGFGHPLDRVASSLPDTMAESSAGPVVEYLHAWADLRSTNGRKPLVAATRHTASQLGEEHKSWIDKYVDSIPCGESIEWVQQFARPLALTYLYEMLNIPVGCRREVAASMQSLQGMMSGQPVGEDLASIEKAISRLHSVFESNSIAGDFASGDARSLLPVMATILRAGRDSTLGLLCGMTWELSRAERRLHEIRESDHDLAVEEILRLATPVHAIGRESIEHNNIGQDHIRIGDSVIVLVGAANRDPRAFHIPDNMEINRSPNPHLSFGVGAHHCLGAASIRFLLRHLLRRLSERFGSVRLTSDPRYSSCSPFMRSFREMNVVFAQ